MAGECSGAPYESASLFYASGTGNTRRVTEWLIGRPRAAGVAVDVRGVEEGSADVAISDGANHLLGLLFPTHAFTAPWSVIRFALGLPRRRGTLALVIPTRGALRVGGVYAPGLEGTGGYLIALLLALKGYLVRGVRAIDMPSNWTVLHPALSEGAVEGIGARAEASVGEIADRLLAGRTWLGGLVPLLLGLLLLPASIGYNLMGRFVLAKPFSASDACDACGLCARECPRQAIRMWRVLGRKPRPYWTYSCESCMRCMNVCPTSAIEASYSFGVAFYFIASVPAAAVALDSAARLLATPTLAESRVLPGVVGSFTKLLAIFVAYLGLTLLLRIPGRQSSLHPDDADAPLPPLSAAEGVRRDSRQGGLQRPLSARPLRPNPYQAIRWRPARSL